MALTTRKPAPTLPALLLQYFGLGALVFALPILEATGNAPEFFVAHGLEAPGLFAFAGAVGVGLPLLLALVSWASFRAGEPWGARVHTTFIGGLLFLLASQGLADAPALLALPLAAALAAVAAFWLRGRSFSQSLLSALGIPGVAWVGMFFFVWPAGDIVRSTPVGPQAAGTDDGVASSGASTNIFIIVFDELPLISLLDAAGDLDAARLPAFAALAERATWYANATTPATQTLHAIPALLTGRRADAPTPTAAEYPRNLFSRLAGSHDLHVFEAGTRMCGPLCETPDVDLRALVVDVAVIFAHRVFPAELRDSLPSVDNRWNDFAGLIARDDVDPDGINSEFMEHLFSNRSARVRDFLESLGHYRERPTLHYLHVGLPHAPYKRLPSGRVHARKASIRGTGQKELPSGIRVRDEPAEVTAYHHQAHLLQVGFVDTLLDRIVRELVRLQLFDASLFIVLSDHGRSFRVSEGMRMLTDHNRADVMFVPLLIKYPGQRAGQIDRSHVSLLDVAATVADVLGRTAGFALDGRSLLDPRPRAVGETLETIDTGRRTSTSYADLASQRADSIAAKARLFSFDRASRFVHRRLEHSSLIGERIEEHPTVSGDLAYQIDQRALLAGVRLDSGFVPATISGSISGDIPEDREFAVILNGRVASVFRTYEHQDRRYFASLSPEAFFREGPNDVEIAEIRIGSDGSVVLSR